MEPHATSPAGAPLLLLVTPSFANSNMREAFENLLRSARLLLTDATCYVLEAKREYSLAYLHAWLRQRTQEWDGPIALLLWAGDDDVLTASSKIGTFDQFVPSIRSARKVLVVENWKLERGYLVHRYRTFTFDGEPVDKPIFLLRASPPYDMSAARELGRFLGTRTSPRVPSSAYIQAVPLGVSSMPPRDEDDTVEIATGSHPRLARAQRPSSQSAIEVHRIESGPPDPRRENEDRISTMPPPAGEGPSLDIPFPRLDKGDPDDSG